MITLSASSYGPESGQYIARVIGRHARWTFEREFIGRKTGKRHDVTEADIDTPGLYEVCSIDRKGRKEQRYVLLLDWSRGLTQITADKRDAMRIGRGLADGLAISQIAATDDGATYQILTPAQRRAADVARTVDKAAEECWQVLQALPLKFARRVVVSLRKRLQAGVAPVDVEPTESAR